MEPGPLLEEKRKRRRRKISRRQKKRRKQKRRKKRKQARYLRGDEGGRTGGRIREQHRQLDNDSTLSVTSSSSSSLPTQGPPPHTAVSNMPWKTPHDNPHLVELLTGGNDHFLVRETQTFSVPEIKSVLGGGVSAATPTEVDEGVVVPPLTVRLPKRNINQRFLLPLEIINSETLRWLPYNPDIRVSIQVITEDDGNSVDDHDTSPSPASPPPLNTLHDHTRPPLHTLNDHTPQWHNLNDHSLTNHRKAYSHPTGTLLLCY